MKKALFGTAGCLLVAAPVAVADANERNFENIITFDVAGVTSGDLRGAPINEVYFLNIGPGNAIAGIGWNVVVTSFGFSWRSEMRVLVTDSTGIGDLSFGPGDSNLPDCIECTSIPSILKLANYNLPNVPALADGLIRLEFFESYDDVPGAPEGLWNSGHLLFQTTIPSPANPALLGLTGLWLVRRKVR